jgi:formylmethanofuran dehydrogenase subunit C
MSALIFKLRSMPSERLDLSALIPSRLAGLSLYEIDALVVAADGARVGDVFDVSGAPGDTVTFDGGSDRLDNIGAGLDGGTVIVNGDVGAYAGVGMKGGRLDIRSNAGAWLASGMTDGLITVKGNAGDFAGAARSGDKQGMAGGIVVADGNIGERAGDRMRRGTIIAKGAIGAQAGSRMMGGTLWTERGFGPSPGPLLRRGTLIGPKVERMLATFADCGMHDLTILRIMNRHFAGTLGALAPTPLPAKVRRCAGDLASIGKGEILLTG